MKSISNVLKLLNLKEFRSFGIERNLFSPPLMNGLLTFGQSRKVALVIYYQDPMDQEDMPKEWIFFFFLISSKQFAKGICLTNSLLKVI